MRIQFLAAAVLATATASAASAQQAAAPPATVFMSDKDIMALVDKAKADRKGDAPVTAEPILLLAPYRAQLEYRPTGAGAAVHEKDAELMVVLQGAGNIVTGGKLVDEQASQRLQPERSIDRRRRRPSSRQGRHDPDPAEYATSGHAKRRRADRTDDHARAVSAGELAANAVRGSYLSVIASKATRNDGINARRPNCRRRGPRPATAPRVTAPASAHPPSLW